MIALALLAGCGCGSVEPRWIELDPVYLDGGPVSVDLSDTATFDVAFEDVSGPVSMVFEIAQPDLSVLVREVEGGIAYDYEAPSITLTAAALLDSRECVLHVCGSDKRAVLERALGAPPPRAPIARLLTMRAEGVRVYWCE